MRRVAALFVSTLALALSACDETTTVADVDAYVPPLPPRDAGPELCAAEGPIDASVPLRDLDLCAEGIVPMGFGIRWQTQAQRLARFATTVDLAEHFPEGCPPGSTMRGATLGIAASSGAVVAEPDPAVVRFDYQVIGARVSEGPEPDGGTLPARMVRGSVTIDLAAGESAGEGLALIDLADAGLDDATHFMVAIDGLDLITDVSQGPEYPASWSAERGYASRGIGATIGTVERDGDTLRVRASVRFEHGILEQPALEPGHDLAVAAARRRATVHFVAIASQVPVTRAGVAYDVRGRAGDPLEGGAPCRGDEGAMAVEIDGEDGVEHGVVGLTRFELALWPDEPRIGDRVRELSVRVLDLTYDPSRGSARMRVDAYASNEGPLPRRAMSAHVEVDVALAQWDGGGDVVALSIAAPLPEGRRSVALPMR